MWRIWLYQRGYDQGLLFSIQSSIQPIQGPQLIGPLQPKFPMTTPYSGAPFSLSLPEVGAPYSIPVQLEGKNLILPTMYLAFQVINQMWPDFSDSSWLCLLNTPPFSEILGIEDSTNKCRWWGPGETHPVGLTFPLDMTNMICVFG